MGKQEGEPKVEVEAKTVKADEGTLAQILERLNGLDARNKELERQLADAKRDRKTYTEGKQPIDEMIGAPRREPRMVPMLNPETKRVDF